MPNRTYTEAAKQDQELIMNCLRRHKLCVANSWGRKRDAYTYKHIGTSTQIDYILLRQACADQKAKSSRPINTPMAGWRKAGHIPALCTMPIRWTP